MTNSDAENSLSQLPAISILLAVRNEGEHIDECLAAVVGLDYPPDLTEIILVDGGSEDGTRGKIAEWQKRDSRIQLLDNVRASTAAGMNIAVAAARFSLCLWISGHVKLESDHLKKCVATMQATGAAAVGGVVRTVGTTAIGRINAAVLSNRFGVGNAPHRVGAKSGWVPTVTMALYRKQAILDVGGFAEQLPRNQDNDLHDRMNRQGLRSYLDVDIRPTYLCRNTLGGLLRQAARNGFWNVMMTRLGYGGLSPRHFAPMAFVGVQLAALMCGIFYPPALWVFVGVATAHLLAALVVAIGIAVQQRFPWQWAAMPIWFVLLHWTYGLSSWRGLLSPRADKQG